MKVPSLWSPSFLQYQRQRGFQLAWEVHYQYNRVLLACLFGNWAASHMRKGRYYHISPPGAPSWLELIYQEYVNHSFAIGLDKTTQFNFSSNFNLVAFDKNTCSSTNFTVTSTRAKKNFIAQNQGQNVCLESLTYKLQVELGTGHIYCLTGAPIFLRPYWTNLWDQRHSASGGGGLATNKHWSVHTSCETCLIQTIYSRPFVFFFSRPFCLYEDTHKR